MADSVTVTSGTVGSADRDGVVEAGMESVQANGTSAIIRKIAINWLRAVVRFRILISLYRWLAIIILLAG